MHEEILRPATIHGETQRQTQELLSAYTNSRVPTQTRVSMDSTSVKLPRIEISTFIGDILKFAEFWAMFESTVDLYQNLPMWKIVLLKE